MHTLRPRHLALAGDPAVLQDLLVLVAEGWAVPPGQQVPLPVRRRAVEQVLALLEQGGLLPAAEEDVRVGVALVVLEPPGLHIVLLHHLAEVADLPGVGGVVGVLVLVADHTVVEILVYLTLLSGGEQCTLRAVGKIQNANMAIVGSLITVEGGLGDSDVVLPMALTLAVLAALTCIAPPYELIALDNAYLECLCNRTIRIAGTTAWVLIVYKIAVRVPDGELVAVALPQLGVDNAL